MQEDASELTRTTIDAQIAPVDDSLLSEVALFSVDSMLLRELGERLVGRPHIALAELVKNSYDADATGVLIRFRPGRIEVIDDGHGMTLSEFQGFWMRVGSPHKEHLRISRHFERPMTGSKGVGRLAVQFLARRLTLRTISEDGLGNELAVAVNWDDAIRAGDLTQARAIYEIQPAQSVFTGGSRHGTALALTSLNQEWGAEDFEELASEIWWLQPPFRPSTRTRSEQKNSFTVRLESPHDPRLATEFEEQLRVILDIWTARLRGRVIRRDEEEASVELTLEFAEDGERIVHTYAARACTPRFAEFEIRIYNLIGRQPKGILVKDAREYFKQFGGVHVYDAGFHLPYYGPDQDWLKSERDHARRQWQSRLLPPELQIQGGLRDLPSNERIFGVVHVDTAYESLQARERSPAGEGNSEIDVCPFLQIQVTRDRLVENRAYDDLNYVVRYAMDFYAMQQARRKLEEAEKNRVIAPPIAKFESIDRVLEEVRDVLPQPVYEELRDGVREAIEASSAESTLYRQRTSLLGALATAGMSALAIEHEVQKQYTMLASAASDLRRIRTEHEVTTNHLHKVADRIDEWISRARATRAIFSYLLDEENREMQARFRAKQLLRDAADQMWVLLRGIEVDTKGVDESLRLPHGGFAEWTAVFQNVIVNAVNAMLDSRRREIAISSRQRGKTREILVQDTGVGVDLDSADKLFEPFERRIAISEERRALGVGGTGLGLTIVRMIAENLGCDVGFVEPENGFSTAFSLTWRET